jgi:uncharacterized repeat protein (TIGR01451 family)
MTLTSDPTPGSNVEGGQVITYTITLWNTGERDAELVLLRDFFPSFMRFVNGSPSFTAPATVTLPAELNVLFARAGNLTIWIIPKVKVGDTWTFSFQATVPDMAVVGIRSLDDSASVTEAEPGGEMNTPAGIAKLVEELLRGKNFSKPVRVSHFQFRGVTIVVHKVDAATGDPLEGAEFALRALKVGEPRLVFDTWYATSNGDGEAIFENVPIGQYEVYESEAPEGYKLNPLRRSININGAVSLLELTISDTRGVDILDDLTPNAGIGSRTEGDCPQ